MTAIARKRERDLAEQGWDALDGYLADLLVPPDPVLVATMAANEAAELPRQDVSPLQGKLLHRASRGRDACWTRCQRSHRLSATAIQTVRSKGYDGLVIAIVNANAPG
jgi:hypothetical protein